MWLSGKEMTPQCEDREQAPEPGLAVMVELSDQELKRTVINVLRAQLAKVACRNRWAM